MKKVEERKSSGLALIPFLVFVGLTVGTGIILNSMGVERAFYQLPASVGVFFAIIVAFIIYKGTIEEKMDSFIKGCSNEDVAIMYSTVFLAGAFSVVAKSIGGVDSFVNLGLTFIPAQYITAGIFLMAGFMAIATGTSSGTVAALIPIAAGVGIKAGLNMPMVIAAVLGGAFLGDNLSIISDTTIVVTRSQGVEMKDKFRVNLLMALPAAIITFVLLLIFGRPETVVPIIAGEYSVIKIIPYLFVLIAAIAGMNVFTVLTVGTLLGGLIGIIYGDLNFLTFAQQVYAGFADMTEIVILAIFIGGLSRMMADEGGLNFLMDKVKANIKGKQTAEIGIAAMVSLADAAVANNTAALIVTGDIAREISHEYKVDPRRTASLLDTFCCVAQGLIPYGNQILLAGILAGGTIAPLQIIPYMWYVMLLGAFAILSIFIPFTDGIIKKNPWNWETGMAMNSKKMQKHTK